MFVRSGIKNDPVFPRKFEFSSTVYLDIFNLWGEKMGFFLNLWKSLKFFLGIMSQTITFNWNGGSIMNGHVNLVFDLLRQHQSLSNLMRLFPMPSACYIGVWSICTLVYTLKSDLFFIWL